MSMLSHGVEYKGQKVDILVTVKVCNKSREAEIEMECVSGQKVTFLTGVNYHMGMKTISDEKSVSTWGVHPADVVENPLPIGAGVRYKKGKWMLEFLSDINFARLKALKPAKKAKIKVVAACSREKELNTSEKFFLYMTNGLHDGNKPMK